MAVCPRIRDDRSPRTLRLALTGASAPAAVALPAFDLADATVSLDEDVLPSTGGLVTPEVSVEFDGTTLTEGTDYTVSYFDNVEPGTASIVVTGLGWYTGSITTTFRIAIGMSRVSISGAYGPFPFSGEPIEPVRLLTHGSDTLVEGVDYDVVYTDNVELGTASITFRGLGAYAGSTTVTFDIVPGLASAVVSFAEGTSYHCTGSPVEPVPTVVLDGVVLEAGTDYDVIYFGNVAPGTADILISGRGSYAGHVNSWFTIMRSLADAEVQVSDQAATGDPITAPVTVLLDGVELVEGTDFTATYESNTAPGIATVTITGIGGYVGRASATFAIIGDLGKATVFAGSQTYTGDAIHPWVAVMMDDRMLIEGTDYTVSFFDNVEAGVGTFQVTGMAGYTGIATGTFSIVPRSVLDALVTVTDETYTGAPASPLVRVSHDGLWLTEGRDFDVVYTDNTEVGTATATITATGNYSGTLTATFEISAAAPAPTAPAPAPTAPNGAVQEPLANTGSDAAAVWGAGALAVALMLGGLVLLGTRRHASIGR